VECTGWSSLAPPLLWYDAALKFESVCWIHCCCCSWIWDVRYCCCCCCSCDWDWSCIHHYINNVELYSVKKHNGNDDSNEFHLFNFVSAVVTTVSGQLSASLSHCNLPASSFVNGERTVQFSKWMWTKHSAKISQDAPKIYMNHVCKNRVEPISSFNAANTDKQTLMVLYKHCHCDNSHSTKLHWSKSVQLPCAEWNVQHRPL